MPHGRIVIVDTGRQTAVSAITQGVAVAPCVDRERARGVFRSARERSSQRRRRREMNPLLRNHALIALSAVLVPTTAAWAAARPDLPPRHAVGQVVYLSGGGDQTQEAAMRSVASRYPLELDFLWGRGGKETPIAVAHWSITTVTGGPLLAASAGGPLILARVPEGRYVVTAQYEGKEVSRIVTIRKGAHDTLVMEWAP
jgi:hypothetical protein